jgi:hypothetical protein
MTNVRIILDCLAIAFFNFIGRDLNTMEITNENSNKPNQFSVNHLDFKPNISKSFANIDFDYHSPNY